MARKKSFWVFLFIQYNCFWFFLVFGIFNISVSKQPTIHLIYPIPGLGLRFFLVGGQVRGY